MATSTRPRAQRARAATRVDRVDEQIPAESAGTSEAPRAEVARTDTGVHADQPTAGRPRAAAQKATDHNSVEVRLPILGSVKLPAADELAFLGGVGVLAVVGAIEWPIAAVLGAGHALAASRRNKVVREFGEALEKV